MEGIGRPAGRIGAASMGRAAIGAVPSISPGFDELSGPWQWATINPGVTYLVAGVGLWILASWGAIVWFYGAGCEIAMHTLFAGTFGAAVLPCSPSVGADRRVSMVAAFGPRGQLTAVRITGVTRKLVAGDLAISIRRMATGANERAFQDIGSHSSCLQRKKEIASVRQQ